MGSIIRNVVPKAFIDWFYVLENLKSYRILLTVGIRLQLGYGGTHTQKRSLHSLRKYDSCPNLPGRGRFFISNSDSTGK